MNGLDLTKEKDVPKNSVDFTIANVDTIMNDYLIKCQIYYEKKFGSVILDFEIGGERTLVSNRVNQKFNGINIYSDNAEFNNFELFEL